MRSLDQLLQRWRIFMAAKAIRPHDKVLDIGCFQGEFLFHVEKRIGIGIGIDPLLGSESMGEKIKLMRWSFQEPMPFPDNYFDVIVMLATIEHINDREAIARESSRLLKSTGRMIITVPEPAVDSVVDLLVRLRWADGMSLEQHSGFRPDTLPSIFSHYGFRLAARRKFQLGLNNLFIFEKI